jgi:hypothetical protein
LLASRGDERFIAWPSATLRISPLRTTLLELRLAALQVIHDRGSVDLELGCELPNGHASVPAFV